MNLNIEAITKERSRQIGERIRQERKCKGWTQAELGEKLADMIDASNEDGKAKSQGNISDWEIGKRTPNLQCLLCLSKLFTCDLGYLLCDYNSRTHGENEISKAIGLSPESVSLLTSMTSWGGSGECTRILDKLIYDANYKNNGNRSILDLIQFFFSYKRNKGEDKTRVLYANGTIRNETKSGFIAPSAINLDSGLIEDAILLEISKALRDLKYPNRSSEGSSTYG